MYVCIYQGRVGNKVGSHQVGPVRVASSRAGSGRIKSDRNRSLQVGSDRIKFGPTTTPSFFVGASERVGE